MLNIYHSFNNSWSLTGLYNLGSPTITDWLQGIKMQLLWGQGGGGGGGGLQPNYTGLIMSRKSLKS